MTGRSVEYVAAGKCDFSSWWQNTSRVLLRRVLMRKRNNCSFLARKFRKYRKLYTTKIVESVDDIVSGEDLGGDEFPMCFIFRVDSRLAADELVTAIKDESFDKKLAVIIRRFVDEISLQMHCASIQVQS